MFFFEKIEKIPKIWLISCFLLLVNLFLFCGEGFIFESINKVEASSSPDYKKDVQYLIPILVDKDLWGSTELLTESIVKNEETDIIIYDGDNATYDTAVGIDESGRMVNAELKEFIKRYADDVQKTIPWVEVVIMPGDYKASTTENGSRIFRILETFKEIRNKTNNLVYDYLGIVLIGDIYIPTVYSSPVYKIDENTGESILNVSESKGFISILPYTDFINRSYVYYPDLEDENGNTGFWLKNNNVDRIQPEIWHGVIKVPTDFVKDANKQHLTLKVKTNANTCGQEIGSNGEFRTVGGFDLNNEDSNNNYRYAECKNWMGMLTGITEVLAYADYFYRNHQFHFLGTIYDQKYEKDILYVDLKGEVNNINKKNYSKYLGYLEVLEDIVYQRWSKHLVYWLEMLNRQDSNLYSEGRDDDGDCARKVPGKEISEMTETEKNLCVDEDVENGQDDDGDCNDLFGISDLTKLTSSQKRRCVDEDPGDPYKGVDNDGDGEIGEDGKDDNDNDGDGIPDNDDWGDADGDTYSVLFAKIWLDLSDIDNCAGLSDYWCPGLCGVDDDHDSEMGDEKYLIDEWEEKSMFIKNTSLETNVLNCDSQNMFSNGWVINLKAKGIIDANGNGIIDAGETTPSGYCWQCNSAINITNWDDFANDDNEDGIADNDVILGPSSVGNDADNDCVEKFANPGEDEPGEDEPGEDEPGEDEPGEEPNPNIPQEDDTLVYLSAKATTGYVGDNQRETFDNICKIETPQGLDSYGKTNLDCKESTIKALISINYDDEVCDMTDTETKEYKDSYYDFDTDQICYISNKCSADGVFKYNRPIYFGSNHQYLILANNWADLLDDNFINTIQNSILALISWWASIDIAWWSGTKDDWTFGSRMSLFTMKEDASTTRNLHCNNWKNSWVRIYGGSWFVKKSNELLSKKLFFDTRLSDDSAFTDIDFYKCSNSRYILCACQKWSTLVEAPEPYNCTEVQEMINNSDGNKTIFLAKDIEDNVNSLVAQTCLHISNSKWSTYADEIVINCNNNSIINLDNSGWIAVLFDKSQFIRFQNCNLVNFETGFKFSDSNYCTLNNNKVVWGDAFGEDSLKYWVKIDEESSIIQNDNTTCFFKGEEISCN